MHQFVLSFPVTFNERLLNTVSFIHLFVLERHCFMLHLSNVTVLKMETRRKAVRKDLTYIEISCHPGDMHRRLRHLV